MNVSVRAMLNNKKKKKNPSQDLLAMMEQTKDVIAAFAGIKGQAMAAGFSEDTAEKIVIEMFRAANKS